MIRLQLWLAGSLIPFFGRILKSQFQPMGALPPLPSEEEQQPRSLGPRMRWLKRKTLTTCAMRVPPRFRASGPAPRFSGKRTNNQLQA